MRNIRICGLKFPRYPYLSSKNSLAHISLLSPLNPKLKFSYHISLTLIKSQESEEISLSLSLSLSLSQIALLDLSHLISIILPPLGLGYGFSMDFGLIRFDFRCILGFPLF